MASRGGTFPSNGAAAPDMDSAAELPWAQEGRVAPVVPAGPVHFASPPAARWRARVGGVVVLVLVALSVAVLVSMTGSHGQNAVIQTGTAPQSEESQAPVVAPVYVHVLGAVASPGLYELSDGARGIDAVAAAGGFTEQADETQLNLARFISDGEQLYVPALGEVPSAAVGGGVATDGRVNINTADAAELETLPRVGPAMSARIIEWRETNGRFSSVDDLQSVTGIGEKTFAELKELVTV